MLGAGVVTLLAVRRLTVRWAPLAALLDLALVFPDEAPSRFAIARRARSVDESVVVLEDIDKAASVQAAAEASLALVVALETHDRATRGHAERVRLLADLVGQELGLTSEDRVRLRWSLAARPRQAPRARRRPQEARPSHPGGGWEQLQRRPLKGDSLVQPCGRGWETGSTPWSSTTNVSTATATPTAARGSARNS